MVEAFDALEGEINCNDKDRPQTDYHHFESLLVLVITAGAFLVVAWVATKALFVFLQESPIP